jgi:Flp pilus assembly protein TadD
MKILLLWTKLVENEEPSPQVRRKKNSTLIIILIFFVLGIAGAFIANKFEEGFLKEVAGPPLSQNRTVTEHLKRAQRLYYQDVNILAAISEYEKASQIEPNNPMIRYELAQAYMTQIASVDFAEAAMKELEAVISLDPSNIEAYKDLAFLYSRGHRSDTQSALYLLEQARRIAPRDKEIFMAIGELKMHEGKPASARTYLWEAHRLSPQDPQTYNAIGQTYYEEGRFTEAVKYFTEALTLLEGTPNLYSLYGKFSTDLYAAQTSEQLKEKVEELGW